jgi:tetratricopeptide (TPR) repeat protein
MPIFLVVPAVIIAVAIGVSIFAIKQGKGQAAPDGRPKNPASGDDSVTAAGKRLEKNPQDIEALLVLGDAAWTTKSWDKAFPIYQQLCEFPSGTKGIDDFLVNFRYGVAAFNKGMNDIAYKSFIVARSVDEHDFESLYYMGAIDFERGNLEKAAEFLGKARTLNPEHSPTLSALGHTLFKLKRYKEAMVNIRKALELSPGDKDALFTLAECYAEAEQTSEALRIYTHLRPDPECGPQACLQAGKINLQTYQYDAAIADFEIGLKHDQIKPEVSIELKYLLGTSYIEKQDLEKAIQYLSEVETIDPNYRNTMKLVSQYAELNKNKNLRIYTLAPAADFIGLCRKIVLTFFSKARVKVTSTSMEGNDWLDILAEIDTPKWFDIVMFRFVRIQGVIGELVLRDFHSHIKEVKAGKGMCFGVGTFSDEARRFVETRLIELIDKPRLTPMLENIDIQMQTLLESQKETNTNKI